MRDANQVVRVIGHTDTAGSDAIDNPLSVNRANALRDDHLAQHHRGPRQLRARGRQRPQGQLGGIRHDDPTPAARGRGGECVSYHGASDVSGLNAHRIGGEALGGEAPGNRTAPTDRVPGLQACKHRCRELLTGKAV